MNKIKKNTESKNDILQSTISSIEKEFGKGSLMRLDEVAANVAVEVIPTASLALNHALGIGGLPKGRIVEIYGNEASGKTTLALSAVAEAQKQGGVAVYVDVEHAVDIAYAKLMGVKLNELLLSQPNSAEEALEIVDRLVRSGTIDIIVVDSVAALVPNIELEHEMGNQQIGVQARLMAQAMRKLTSSINKNKTVAVFINQIREKIGVVFGNPETTPGGRALKFASSIRIELRKAETITVGSEAVGNAVKAKIVKNKLAPPFTKTQFTILYNEGISRTSELLDLGCTYKVVTRNGPYYSYNDTKLGQGAEQSRNFLKENPVLSTEIEEKIIAQMQHKST